MSRTDSNSRQPFNIVRIQPRGQPASGAHADVARLLYHSFESLSHPVALQVNTCEVNAINILIGCERMATPAFSKDVRYIPYQLEQLARGGVAISSSMMTIMQGAMEVWDYDPSNIEVLKQIGIKSARLLPLGYHEKLMTIQRRADEDIDVLFYGLLNPRRQAIIDALKDKSTVKTLQFVYGEERDKWIARAKIVLNMHFYPAQIAEQVRVSYLLNNAKCVVSEQSDHDPLGHLCAVAPYDRLTETCMKLLADRDERERIIAAAHDGFRQMPMTGNLRAVLK